jgi:hypothetical protein
MELISRLAKHACGQHLPFSDTTLSYLADEAAVAIALKTHEVTQLL